MRLNDLIEEDWKDTLKKGSLGLAAAGSLFSTPPNRQETLPLGISHHSVSSIDKSVLDKFSAAMQSKAGRILRKVAEDNGIKGDELAQFLAQCASESQNFTQTIEMGTRNYFKKYDIAFSPKKAQALGNMQTGDGYRYRGRGYIQLTGKANYERAEEALNLPLVENQI